MPNITIEPGSGIVGTGAARDTNEPEKLVLPGPCAVMVTMPLVGV